MKAVVAKTPNSWNRKVNMIMLVYSCVRRVCRSLVEVRGLGWVKLVCWLSGGGGAITGSSKGAKGGGGERMKRRASNYVSECNSLHRAGCGYA